MKVMILLRTPNPTITILALLSIRQQGQQLNFLFKSRLFNTLYHINSCFQQNNVGRKPFTHPKTASKPTSYSCKTYETWRQETSEIISSLKCLTKKSSTENFSPTHYAIAVTELNYLGCRLTADDDDSFCCPACHCQSKKSHIYEHIRELRKKRQPSIQFTLQKLKDAS